MDEGIPVAERLAQLREENDYLRRAAHTFGELAERLMFQLDVERRRHSRTNRRVQAGRSAARKPNYPT